VPSSRKRSALQPNLRGVGKKKTFELRGGGKRGRENDSHWAERAARVRESSIFFGYSGKKIKKIDAWKNDPESEGENRLLLGRRDEMELLRKGKKRTC